MSGGISLALLSFASVAPAWIDLRRGIIPDWLNLAIALAGLSRVAVLDGSTAALLAACQGVTVGATVWLLRMLYFKLRQYQGLGRGDVELLAASGVWIGIAGVPAQLLAAALSALAVAGILKLAGAR